MSIWMLTILVFILIHGGPASNTSIHIRFTPFILVRITSLVVMVTSTLVSSLLCIIITSIIWSFQCWVCSPTSWFLIELISLKVVRKLTSLIAIRKLVSLKAIRKLISLKVVWLLCMRLRRDWWFHSILSLPVGNIKKSWWRHPVASWCWAPKLKI